MPLIKKLNDKLHHLMTIRHDDEHTTSGGGSATNDSQSSNETKNQQVQPEIESHEQDLQQTETKSVHSDATSPEQAESINKEETDSSKSNDTAQKQSDKDQRKSATDNEQIDDRPRDTKEDQAKSNDALSEALSKFKSGDMTEEEQLAAVKAQEAINKQLDQDRQAEVKRLAEMWTVAKAPNGKKAPKNYLNQHYLDKLKDDPEKQREAQQLMFRTRRPLSYETLKLLLDEELSLRHLYDDYKTHRNRHNRPIEYGSREEVRLRLKTIAEDYKTRKAAALGKANVNLDVADAAWIILKTAALTVVPSGATGFALAAYDYDRKVYTLNPNGILQDYLAAIFDSVSRSQLQSLTMTLEGRRDELAVYHALPSYKLAVGNGIFNCITKTLEPSTPNYTILTKINTNYNPNAKEPDYGDGFTLEKMIDNLANHVQERVSLIKEVVKAILTGRTIKPAVFFVVGRGGDGKSTFFSLIANILGKENVAYLNMSEIDKPDKLLEIIGKKLILGTDNDIKLYIKKTASIKTIASHEVMSFTRKYLTAIAAQVTATMVQLCNQFPRFAETGSSMRRRIVPFRAEHSYYEENSENANVDDKYVYDKAFKEYALKYFLECEYHADFNDVDAGMALDSFDNEDTITQFLQDMDDQGVFAKNQRTIPTSHLYAAYCDWLESSNPGARPLAKRAFTSQLSEPMATFGYKVVNHGAQRVSTMAKSHGYIPDLWGSMKDSGHLKDIMAKTDNVSQAFSKADRRIAPRKMTRDDHVISPEEYFGLIPDLYEIERKHPQFKDTNLVPGIYDYNDLSDVMDIDYTELSQPFNETTSAGAVQLREEAAHQEYAQYKADLEARGIAPEDIPTVTPLVVMEQQRVAKANAQRAEGDVSGLVNILEGTASAKKLSLQHSRLIEQQTKNEKHDPDDNDKPISKPAEEALLATGAAAAADGLTRLDVDRPSDLTVVSDALAKSSDDPSTLTKAVKVLNGMTPFIDPCGSDAVRDRLKQNLFSPKMSKVLPPDNNMITLSLLEQQARNAFNGFDQSHQAAQYRAVHGYIDLDGLVNNPAAMSDEQVDVLIGAKAAKNEHDKKLAERNVPTIVTFAREISKQISLLKNDFGGNDANVRLAASGLVGLVFDEPQFAGARSMAAEHYIKKVGLTLADADLAINGDQSFMKQMIGNDISEEAATAAAINEVDAGHLNDQINDMKGGAN